jgi:hypothetical protein
MATTLTPQLPKEFLAAARKGQEYALDAIKTWIGTVQSVVPGIPAVQIPFADRLPKPEAVLANAYDFAGQLLASQRHFAEELLKATEPLMPAVTNGRTAPQTPAAHTASTAPQAPAADTASTAPQAPATHTAPKAAAASTRKTPPRASVASNTRTTPKAASRRQTPPKASS